MPGKIIDKRSICITCESYQRLCAHPECIYEFSKINGRRKFRWCKKHIQHAIKKHPEKLKF